MHGDAGDDRAVPHEGQPLIASKPSAGPRIDRAFVVAVHHGELDPGSDSLSLRRFLSLLLARSLAQVRTSIAVLTRFVSLRLEISEHGFMVS